MADTILIGGLIETYRTLNNHVRMLPEEKLRAQNGQTSVRDIMRHVRDDELRFSQALKERISGVPVADVLPGEDLPTLGTETVDDTTAMLIAQFGTARESTLAMLRDLPESEWDATPQGGDSIRAQATELLNNDRRQLERISGILGGVR